MKARSLQSRIMLPLYIALGLATLVAVSGTSFNLMDTIGRDSSADAAMLPYIAASIDRVDGRFRVVPTEEIQEIGEDDGLGLWFIARDAADRELRYGGVPAHLESMAAVFLPKLNDDVDGEVRRIDINDTDDLEGAPSTVFVARWASPQGDLRIMFGRRPQTESFILELISDLRFIFLPVLTIALLAALLAAPILVRRALSRLDRITDIAASIDVDRRGQRLPLDEVPEEVIPLVNAVNTALSRLDHGYTQQRRFLADAAHELRTPVAILQTNLEAMPTSRLQQKLLNDVGRLANTAEQLLDLHRADNDLQNMQDVDIVSLGKSVVADLAPNAIGAGYELTFTADRDRIVIRGDVGALERVIANLVRNAIEHGGSAGQIRIMVSYPNVIEVCDDGPGIPADQREAVFEPFYRLSPKSTGAGLGLNLVKQIVRHHGGHVSVVPSDRGTRFHISF